MYLPSALIELSLASLTGRAVISGRAVTKKRASCLNQAIFLLLSRSNCDANFIKRKIPESGVAKFPSQKTDADRWFEKI